MVHHQTIKMANTKGLLLLSSGRNVNGYNFYKLLNNYFKIKLIQIYVYVYMHICTCV